MTKVLKLFFSAASLEVAPHGYFSKGFEIDRAIYVKHRKDQKHA